MGSRPLLNCKLRFVPGTAGWRKGLTWALLALAIGGCAHAPAPVDPARFEADIRAFEDADRKSPPAPGGTLFVGSSSIRLWKLGDSFPGLKALNRGFGGSHISDCTAFVDRIVVPYRPARIFFYAGDNDIAGGKSPETLHSDWKRFREAVHKRLVDVRIVFLSIKPSPSRWNLWPAAQRANALIEADCSLDLRLKYLDVATPMLGKDGLPRPELYLEDRLHMNAEGYKLWTSILEPHVH